jgi:hypothetical protein
MRTSKSREVRRMLGPVRNGQRKGAQHSECL